MWLDNGSYSVVGRGVGLRQTTLLDFYSDACGPCRAMAPAVDALARSGYAVQRINVTENRELAARFNVTAIPCFVVVDGNREVDRVVGLTTVERLKLKLRRQPAPNKREAKKGRPHPAWRYERAAGYRAAVVRIYCQDDAHTRSIGSGVLVRWEKRIVVLTARHVVQDAKKVLVQFHTRRTCYARVLKTDLVWDCAVLQLVGPPPSDVRPADVEMGDAAMQHQGSRLESCGYGPDGKLACNTGLFLGYKRSTQAKNGPDDWMEISGHARSGDSGGPIFDRQGRGSVFCGGPTASTSSASRPAASTDCSTPRSLPRFSRNRWCRWASSGAGRRRRCPAPSPLWSRWPQWFPCRRCVATPSDRNRPGRSSGASRSRNRRR